VNSKIIWSIALGISLLFFAVNAFWKKKTSASNVASGFILWQAFDHWLDYVIYPAVLLWLGFMWGFGMMFVVTLISNTAYILINNSTVTDWTLMSRVVTLPVLRNIVSWKIGRFNIGKAIGFIFFAIKFDSFYAVNSLFGKDADLRKTKVQISFLASHAVCNIAWTSLWGVAFVFVKSLMQTLPTP